MARSLICTYRSGSRVLRSVCSSIILATAFVAALPALADESCVDFKWDVSQERALFAGSATPLAAAADPKSAPVLLLNHLYEL